MTVQFGRAHVIGATHPPLLESTIGETLRVTAAKFGTNLALSAPDEAIHWSWEELSSRTDQLASGFLDLGLRTGDRIGIWAPNCCEWVLTQLAAARLGLVLVTINPAYRSTELSHALRLSGCRALVIAADYKGSDLPTLLTRARAETPEDVRALEFVIGIKGAAPGCIDFSDLAAAARRAERLEAAEALLTSHDPINIQFTSGTTGAPKGATLTHRNILNNANFVGAGLSLSHVDRVCVPVPLYHCFGMVMGVLAGVVHGAGIVLPSPVFDARAVLKAVESERCTALYGVPTMFVSILDHPEFARFDLSSLRTGIMAGAPCPAEVMKRVIGQMHMHDVTICYGMTETSPVSFQTRLDADLETRVATVGTIHPHVEAKVVNGTGDVAAHDESGELLVRGYGVMQGYWNDEARTRDAIDAAGWMHTGDLATIDSLGRGRIVGRVKDMIIRGGENIYPAEVENFLYTHPAIAEAAVFGVPHPRYGEEVCAWIKLRAPLSEDALRDFCAARIAPFKVPRHIRFVEALPMTVTGKVQKFVMRDALSAELAKGRT